MSISTYTGEASKVGAVPLVAGSSGAAELMAMVSNVETRKKVCGRASGVICVREIFVFRDDFEMGGGRGRRAYGKDLRENAVENGLKKGREIRTMGMTSLVQIDDPINMNDRCNKRQETPPSTSPYLLAWPSSCT
jgi:hypothetical protein